MPRTRELTDQELRFVAGDPSKFQLLSQAERDRLREMLQQDQVRADGARQVGEQRAGSEREAVLAPGDPVPPEQRFPEQRDRPVEEPREGGILGGLAQMASKIPALMSLAPTLARRGPELLAGGVAQVYTSTHRELIETLTGGQAPPLPRFTDDQKLEALGVNDLGGRQPGEEPGIPPGVEIDPITGRMRARDMTFPELVAGQIIGEPGMGIPGYRDPRLEGIEPPPWPEIQAERMLRIGEFLGRIPGFVPAMLDTIQSIVPRELNGDRVLMRGVNAYLDIIGLEYYGFNAGGLPVGYIWRSSKAGPTVLDPASNPHPIEDYLPWPFRWASKFAGATPGAPSPLMITIANAPLRLRDTVAQGIEYVRSGEALEAAKRTPDLLDFMVTNVAEQLNQDNLAFLDPVERQKLFEDRPEVILDHLFLGLWGTGAAMRAIGALPKTAKGLTALRLVEKHARGQLTSAKPEIVVAAMGKVLHPREMKYYRRLADRAVKEGRATPAALGTQRVLQQAEEVTKAETGVTKVADDVRTQTRDTMVEEMDRVVAETATPQDRAKAIARRLLVESENSEPGLHSIMHKNLEETARRTQDFVEFLSQHPGNAPVVRRMKERFLELPERLAAMQDEIAAVGASGEQFGQRLDELRLATQQLLETSVGHGDARLQTILDDMLSLNDEALDQGEELLKLVELYKQKTGRKIPAVTGGMLLAAQGLWGEDAINDPDMMFALGPLAVLGMLVPGLSGGARKQLLGRVTDSLSFRGAEILRRVPKLAPSVLFERIGKGHKHAGMAIEELKRVAPEILDPKNPQGLLARSRSRLAETVKDLSLDSANPFMAGLMRRLKTGQQIGTISRRARDGAQRMLGTSGADLLFATMSRALAQGKKPGEALDLGVAAVVAAGPNAARARKALKLRPNEGAFYRQVWRGEKPPQPALAKGVREAVPTNAQRYDQLAREEGAAVVELARDMGGSALGMAIGGTLAYRASTEEGPNFLPIGLIFGPLMGFGFARFLTRPGVLAAVRKLGDPKLREATKGIFSIGDRTPDFEEFFRRGFIDLFPEEIDPEFATRAETYLGKLDPGKATRSAAFAGATVGGAIGGAVAAVPDELEPDLFTTLFGAATGALLGGAAAGGIMRALATRVFKGKIRPRQMLEQLLLTDKGRPADFVRMQRRTRARFDGAMMEIKDVAAKLDRMGPEIGAQIDAVLRGTRSLDTIPAPARLLAAQTRLIFDELSLGLVEVGLAQGVLKETILTNLGSYLPRMYLAYEGDDATRLLDMLEKWGHANKVSRWKLSDLNWLKARKNLPEPVREALGEITNNPAYLLGKFGIVTSQDIQNMKLMNWIASSEHTLAGGLLPRRVSDAEVFRFAKDAKLPIPDKRHPFRYAKQRDAQPPSDPESLAQIQGEISHDFDDMFRRIREQERGGLPEAEFFNERGQMALWKGQRYRRMPADRKYGPLAGKYVNDQLALDQMVTREVPGDLKTIIDVMNDVPLGIFKSAKVLYNPATLFRNLVSNVILLDQAGVSPIWRAGTWIEAIRQFPILGREAGPLFLEARKAGTFGGEFRAGEIAPLLKGWDKAKLRGSNALGLMTGNALGLARRVNPLKKMERFHEASEQIGKMVAYTHARRTLRYGPAEAAEFAKRWIFDYPDVPDWIKFTRRSIFGAPFITFSYKAIPRILENMIAVGDPKKMVRFYKWIGILGAVNEYSARKFGSEAPEGSPPGGYVEHLKRIAAEGLFTTGTALRIAQGGTGIGDPYGFKKFLPDYSGPSQMLLSSTDTWGRQTSADITWYSPWGDFGELGKGPLGRNLAKLRIPWPRFLEPGNPIFHLGVAAVTNRDVFTGREILTPELTPMEQAADLGKYMIRLWGPALLNSEGYSYEKVRRALLNDVAGDPFTPDLATALTSEVLGFKRRPFDPRQSVTWRTRERNWQLAQLEKQITRLIKRGAPNYQIDNRKWAQAQVIVEFARRFGLEPPEPNEVLEGAVRDKLEQLLESGKISKLGETQEEIGRWMEAEIEKIKRENER